MKLLEAYTIYPSVYLLLKLRMIFPEVAVEKVFLVIKIVKNRLRNQMRYQRVNDYPMTYIEKEVVMNIDTKFTNIEKGFSCAYFRLLVALTSTTYSFAIE